jgi:hypothetical protein
MQRDMHARTVCDLECVEIQVVETQQRNGVLDSKTQHESLDKVCRLLERARVVREIRCLQRVPCGRVSSKKAL